MTFDKLQRKIEELESRVNTIEDKQRLKSMIETRIMSWAELLLRTQLYLRYVNDYWWRHPRGELQDGYRWYNDDGFLETHKN